MTDEQFIKGMWNRVDAIADSEAEIIKAEQISRELKRREIIHNGIIIFGIMAACCLAQYYGDIIENAFTAIIPIAIFVMTTACYLDGRQYSVNKKDSEVNISYGKT